MQLFVKKFSFPGRSRFSAPGAACPDPLKRSGVMLSPSKVRVVKRSGKAPSLRPSRRICLQGTIFSAGFSSEISYYVNDKFANHIDRVVVSIHNDIK